MLSVSVNYIINPLTVFEKTFFEKTVNSLSEKNIQTVKLTEASFNLSRQTYFPDRLEN